MLILLIIALTAIIVLSLIIYILNKALKYSWKIQHYDLDLNDKNDIKKAFELLSNDKIICDKLIIFIAYNENIEDSIVYDFSQYKEKNIVGLTYYVKEKTYRMLQEEYEEDENEDCMLVSVFENQTIYQFKDGGYQWDISSLL